MDQVLRGISTVADPSKDSQPRERRDTARYYHLDANPGREALEKFAPTFGAAMSADAAPLPAPDDEDNPVALV